MSPNLNRFASVWGLGLFCLLMTSADANARIGSRKLDKLYNYYFPKHGGLLRSDYRRYIDRGLLNNHSNFGNFPRSRAIFYAARGDPIAFHQFVHQPERAQGGEYGLDWAFECPFLLLHLGDDRFAELLAKEDANTRQMVGSAIDAVIEWTEHEFPKTQKLYISAYRFVTIDLREWHRAQRRKERP
jgi:hypothetical protein